MTEKMNANKGKYYIPDRSLLLDMLLNIQETSGYLSEEAIAEVGKQLGLASAKIYGIASFYDQFRFEPIGKYHIKVCDGTSCHLSESSAIIRELEKILKIKKGQTTRDGKFSLETVTCLGACEKAAIISINNNYYTEIIPEKLKEFLDNLNETEE